MSKIYYNKQYIDNKDIKFVKNSLKKKLITNGPNVDIFEKLIKKKLKSKYSLVCNSGTSALHLAMMALELKKNDIVIIPSVNFIASYSMAKLMGAKIFFSDVSKETGQMTPDLIEECIKKNRLKKIKLIITMYLGGTPYNVEKFYKLKKKYKFYIIEDACHALGAYYKIKNRRFAIGSCKHSDISTFSFHPVKSITTGEGGAVTTNNKIFYNKIKILRSHGIIRNPNKYFEYDIKKLSNNYRISDINCALGISQILKIDKIIIKRRKLYNIYCKKLETLKNFINIPKINNLLSAHHLMLVSFKNFTFKKKVKLIHYLNKNKIYPQFHYIPLYKFKVVKDNNDGIFGKYGSEKFYSSFLSLPLFYNLKISSIDKVVKLLKTYLTRPL